MQSGVMEEEGRRIKKMKKNKYQVTIPSSTNHI